MRGGGSSMLLSSVLEDSGFSRSASSSTTHLRSVSIGLACTAGRIAARTSRSTEYIVATGRNSTTSGCRPRSTRSSPSGADEQRGEAPGRGLDPRAARPHEQVGVHRPRRLPAAASRPPGPGRPPGPTCPPNYERGPRLGIEKFLALPLDRGERVFDTGGSPAPQLFPRRFPSDRVGRVCEQLCESIESVRRFVAGLDPAALDGADAAHLVETFSELERLASAGRTLAAGRVAQTNAWVESGHRDAGGVVGVDCGHDGGQGAGDARDGRAVGRVAGDARRRCARVGCRRCRSMRSRRRLRRTRRRSAACWPRRAPRV